MGLEITSNASGTKRRLRRMSERAEDLRPLWPKVERYLAREFARQIDSEGGRLGTPWQPLNARSAAQKAAEGLRQPLVRTGGLRASYLGEGPWAISEHEAQAMRMGSRAPHAHLHQKGTKGGHVPKRPVLVVTEDMVQHVRQMVKDYLLERDIGNA